MAVLNPSVNAQVSSKAEIHPRLMMEVSPELVELLDKLAAKSQTTRTEVLRKAIGFSGEHRDKIFPSYAYRPFFRLVVCADRWV